MSVSTGAGASRRPRIKVGRLWHGYLAPVVKFLHVIFDFGVKLLPFGSDVVVTREVGNIRGAQLVWQCSACGSIRT